MHCNRLNDIYVKLNKLLEDYKHCQVLKVGAIPYLLSNVIMQNEAISLMTINRPMLYE